MTARQISELVWVSNGDLKGRFRCLFDTHTWLCLSTSIFKAHRRRLNRRRMARSRAREIGIITQVDRVHHAAAHRAIALLCIAYRQRLLFGRGCGRRLRLAWSAVAQWAQRIQRVIDSFELSSLCFYATGGSRCSGAFAQWRARAGGGWGIERLGLDLGRIWVSSQLWTRRQMGELPVSPVDSAGLGAWELDLEGTSAVVRCVCLNVTFSHTGKICTSPWRVLSIHWQAYSRGVVRNIEAFQGLDGPYWRWRDPVGVAREIQGVDLPSAVLLRSHCASSTSSTRQWCVSIMVLHVIDTGLQTVLGSRHGYESKVCDLLSTVACHCRFQLFLHSRASTKAHAQRESRVTVSYDTTGILESSSTALC